MPFLKEHSRYYDLIYEKRDYEGEAKFVYRWAGKPQLIIDLGCGTGAHHKYWDCAVIGIDQSKSMLSCAKKSKGRMYRQANIEKLSAEVGGHYCYTALFNVIGYCDLESVISGFGQPKGGMFIFDVWDKGKFEKEGFQRRVKEFRWGKVEINPYRPGFREEVLEIVIKPKGCDTIREYHNVHPYAEETIYKLCKKHDYFCEKKNTNSWTAWYKLTKQ